MVDLSIATNESKRDQLNSIDFNSNKFSLLCLSSHPDAQLSSIEPRCEFATVWLRTRARIESPYKTDRILSFFLIQKSTRTFSTSAMVSYTLPALPYAYEALEPSISREIMTLHHTKHHAT